MLIVADFHRCPVHPLEQLWNPSGLPGTQGPAGHQEKFPAKNMLLPHRSSGKVSLYLVVAKCTLKNLSSKILMGHKSTVSSWM